MHSVKSCELAMCKAAAFCWEVAGLSGRGLSEKGRRMQLGHRGFNLHSLLQRAVSEGKESSMEEHICPQPRYCRSSVHRQVHDLSGANRKN